MNRRDLLAGIAAFVSLPVAGLRMAGAVEPILSLRGAFAKAGPDGEWSASLGELDALPQTSFSTTTPWHAGAVEFSGVALKDYFAAVGARPTTIRLTALNDYSVDADVAELVAADALLATRQNGQPMPVADKGPVFMLFPFDSRSELKHQTYYSRSVWQLSEIDIVA